MSISLSPPINNSDTILDASYFVYEDDTSILIPYPKAEAILLGALFAPFQIKVSFKNWRLYKT